MLWLWLNPINIYQHSAFDGFTPSVILIPPLCDGLSLLILLKTVKTLFGKNQEKEYQHLIPIF